jgi:hypothetical protein
MKTYSIEIFQFLPTVAPSNLELPVSLYASTCIVQGIILTQPIPHKALKLEYPGYLFNNATSSQCLAATIPSNKQMLKSYLLSTWVKYNNAY